MAGVGVSLIAACDPAPVFQVTKHYLDASAAVIVSLVVAYGLGTQLPTGDAGAYPLVFQRIPEPVGFATPVRDHPLGSWQVPKLIIRLRHLP